MGDDRANLREPVARLRMATAAALAAATDSTLRQLVQAVADEVRQLSAEVERLYDNGFVGSEFFFGLYRGTVVSNLDPTGRGRLQVSVPEISAEVLGWAVPSLPLGPSEGQSASSAAAIWVMFEQGDPSRPVAIGSCPV